MIVSALPWLCIRYGGMPRDLLISASDEGDDPVKCKFTGVESLEDLAVRLGEKLGLGVEFWRDARGLSTQAAWRLIKLVVDIAA